MRSFHDDRGHAWETIDDLPKQEFKADIVSGSISLRNEARRLVKARKVHGVAVMSEMKLKIELVPSTVWYSSLYRLLPNDVWNNIRSDIIASNGRKCQICGETEGTMNLHEIWEYNDQKHIQKLVGFTLLCKMCHHVKHIGLAGILADD